MRRVGLVSRLVLLVMCVLVAAVVAAIGLHDWRAAHGRPAVLHRASWMGQAAAIVDTVMRTGPEEMPTVLRAVSGNIMRAEILPEQPPLGSLVPAPHVADKVRSLMRTNPPAGLVAYTDGVKEGLAYPREGLEGVLRRLVVPLGPRRLLVVGVMVVRQEYGVTILGLPEGFWIGLLGVAVAALAIIAALRELAPLRRLADEVSLFDGQTPRTLLAAEDDGTELARLVRAVGEMQARIATLSRERSFLIGAISHDAKTYLTRLRLRAEEVDDADRRDALIRNIDAIAELIDTALAYARGTAITQRRGLVDLSDLVAAEIAEREAVGAGVRFDVRLDEAAGVEGDAVALKRVVANLLDNAQKFGHGSVAVEVRVADGRCRLVVADDGPGIAPQDRELVFSPFYRAEKSRNRQTGGTGLGLAIAHQIVEAHGGAIVVDPADGARIVVTLSATTRIGARAAAREAAEAE